MVMVSTTLASGNSNGNDHSNAKGTWTCYDNLVND